VQTAVDNSTTTLQAIPDVQAKVAELPVAQTAVSTATAAIQDTNTKIVLAQQAYDTATATAAVVPAAQAGVSAATATVANAVRDVTVAQSIVDSSTATVASTEATLTALQDAQPALDAAAACTEGSACVHFYNTNAELGPLHDQIDSSQSASDAAVAAVPVAQAAVDSATTQVATQEQALTDAANAATQAQAAADASAVITTTNGVTATVYRATNGAAPSVANPTPVLTTTVPNIAFNWGSGVVLNSGLADHVIIRFDGVITVPSDATAVKYAVYSDDGSKLYVNGTLAISNWKDQVLTWSAYSPTY